MSDSEARRLGLILTGITVVLAVIGICAHIYFYTPSHFQDRSDRISGGKAGQANISLR